MGKIIRFPTNNETPKNAEDYNRSLPATNDEQAEYRRDQFRVLNGGKDD